MPDILTILRVALFSGLTSCGLAILRGTKLKLLSTVYLGGFFCGGIFYIINTMGYPFAAGFACTSVVCLIVRYYHHKEKHGYLFLIIPCIYCITPGAALYRLFFDLLNKNWIGANDQLVYTAKVILGCWLAMLAVTEITDNLIGKKADENFFTRTA